MLAIAIWTSTSFANLGCLAWRKSSLRFSLTSLQIFIIAEKCRSSININRGITRNTRYFHSSNIERTSRSHDLPKSQLSVPKYLTWTMNSLQENPDTSTLNLPRWHGNLQDHISLLLCTSSRGAGIARSFGCSMQFGLQLVTSNLG